MRFGQFGRREFIKLVGGDHVSWELRKLRKDGEALWVRETASNMTGGALKNSADVDPGLAIRK
jgi:hypothetical protein